MEDSIPGHEKMAWWQRPFRALPSLRKVGTRLTSQRNSTDSIRCNGRSQKAVTKGGRFVKHFRPISSSVPKRVDNSPRTLHQAKPVGGESKRCLSAFGRAADHSSAACPHHHGGTAAVAARPRPACVPNASMKQKVKEIVQVKLPF